MLTGGVMVVTDKQARLKPCLRCGYSLRYTGGVKNCPECGLAVRVSLANNPGLDWSNPRWQRYMAGVFGVFILAMVLKLIVFTSLMVLYYDDEDYSLESWTIFVALRTEYYLRPVIPLVCGVALCLLANRERRHPDTFRAVRICGLTAGMLLIIASLLSISARYGIPFNRSRSFRHVIALLAYGLWGPLMVSAIVGKFAVHFAQRGSSKRLRQLAKIPLGLVGFTFISWLLGFEDLWWGIRPILDDALFPLAMVLLLVVMIRVLRAGAREAETNWVTDP